MKKATLLNSEISRVISRMGHTDMLTIGDAGLPIPGEAERIDVAVCSGIPSFLDVLHTVLSELEVQSVIIASEMKEKNGILYETLKSMFADKEIIEVPHEEFKVKTKQSMAVVRTGEFKPYANIILVSGVIF